MLNVHCTTDNSLKIQSQSPVRRVNVKKLQYIICCPNQCYGADPYSGGSGSGAQAPTPGVKVTFKMFFLPFFSVSKQVLVDLFQLDLSNIPIEKKVLFQNCKI